MSGGNTMKRWICIMMSVLLAVGMFLPMENVWAETDISHADEVQAEESIETVLRGNALPGMGRGVTVPLNLTFPTVDGGTASLCGDASKDVTVLVFGQIVCSNTYRVLQEIAGSGWIHDPKVHVIFAEISKEDQTATKEFLENYGCEEITGCYSTEGGISILMWQYLQEAGMGGTITLPAIVLLDAGDNVRKVTTGHQSASDLYHAMSEFAEVSGSESDAKVEQERTLSVSGQENYQETEKVLALINQTRTAEGAQPLELDAGLTETAMVRAAELSLYFDHMRPCGKTCFTIFRDSTRHAENIAVNNRTAESVMDSWNSSAGHHANIINPDYTSVGIGCFTDSNGTIYWVQCFDNEAANAPVKSGVLQVQRELPIWESRIHLAVAGEGYTAGCKEGTEKIELDIRNRNEFWPPSVPQLMPTNFNYNSSNPAVAEVDADGTITIKAVGTSEITASLKENPSMKVSYRVTKQNHSYQSAVVAPTTFSQGYTRHTCKSCGKTYMDNYKPALAAGNTPPATKTETGTPAKPKGTILTGLTPGRKGFTARWKKPQEQITGYELQYSTSRKFKGVKTIKNIKAKTTSKKITKLKARKKYYVRIRTYKNVKVNGKSTKLCSGWSKAKKVTTKR